jgi:hypothetical protein
MQVINSIVQFLGYLVILTSVIACIYCIYAWRKYREYLAVTFFALSAYFLVFYVSFVLFNPAEIVRQIIVRAGIVVAMVVIIIWLRNLITIQRSKNGR